MGLFSKPKPLPPEELTSREYLAHALTFPRTTHLAGSFCLRAAELPVGSAEQLGALLTIPAVTPVSEMVRSLMVHDRDLSGWIARKAVKHLELLMTTRLEASFDASYDAVFGAAGFASPPGQAVVPLETIPDPAPADLEGAIGLATVVAALIPAVMIRDHASNPGGMAILEDLYTGESGQDVERLAYDVIAWLSIVVARLNSAGRLSHPLPFLDPSFREIPPLHREGWFPNPANTGGLEHGDAKVQRYWNGQWTDRLRVRDGQSWVTVTASLHDKPTD